jgi:hypothetical protein
MLLGACLSGVALIGTWGAIQFAGLWVDKLVEQAPENSLAGLSPEDMSAKKAFVQAKRSEARSYTQICGALGAILGSMGGALLGNAIGRRITYTGLCLTSLVCAETFFQVNTSFGPLFLVTIFLAGMTTSAFYGWLPLYLPELYPTSVRATGQGFSFNFGRILAAVGALQTGNLIGLFGGSYPKACSVICLIYVVGAVLIWVAPETHGKDLPE